MAAVGRVGAEAVAAKEEAIAAAAAAADLVMVVAAMVPVVATTVQAMVAWVETAEIRENSILRTSSQVSIAERKSLV